MRNNVYFIYLLALLAVAFWGISYVWMKVVFEYYSPITTMFFRLSLSSIFMFVALKLMRKKEKIDPADYKSFVLLSFFAPFCYFLGESFGLRLVSPTIAAVIISTIPVFTPFLGYFAFKEKLSALNVMGFFVSFLGVVIMIFDADFKFSASPLGIGLLFVAVVSALINVLFLRRLAQKYSSLTIIQTQNLLGALFFMPLFLFFDVREVIHIPITSELVWALLKLSVFASTLAFMFYTIAFRVIGVARTSIFSNLIPVFTAVFSWLLWKESIDVSKIIGMSVVICGLLLSQVSRFRFFRKRV